MKITTYQEDRSTVLIANFKGGYATGWRFAVPVAFRDALDIKFTEYRHLGHAIEAWTQGRLFCFPEGSLLYDTQLAYELKWGEALQHITLVVQVTKSIACEYRPSETVETRQKKIEIIRTAHAQKTRPKEESLDDGLTVATLRYYPGIISFDILRPAENRLTLERVEQIGCSQEQFVSFLQTGMLTNKESFNRDIFKNSGR